MGRVYTDSVFTISIVGLKQPWRLSALSRFLLRNSAQFDIPLWARPTRANFLFGHLGFWIRTPILKGLL